METLSQPDKIEPALLQNAADRLAGDLRRADREAHRLAAAVAAARPELGAAAEPLERATEKLLAAVRDRPARADQARDEVRRELATEPLREAFRYLGTKELPPSEHQEVTHAGIKQALAALADRKSEDKVEALVAPLHAQDLEHAIEEAEVNLFRLELCHKPVGEALDVLDRLVSEQVALARPVHRAARDVEAALADLPAGDGRGLPELRAAGKAVVRTGELLRTASEELHADFRAARHDYTARRYDREAHCAQEAADLYEVLVRKEDVVSEGHRVRSYEVFSCMLVAQAGVTFATLSLAMRRRGILWSLGSVAGLSALMFTAYVFTGI
jgi:hypothetical protein